MEENGNVSKNRRFEEDLISDLPDPILTEILSRLPTKNAVSTSILSTRWKNVPPFNLSKIVIDLDDSLLLNPMNDTFFVSDTFISFVDKLLNETLSAVSYVDTFSLKCSNFLDPDKFISWVCTIVRRLSVRDLRLKFCLHDKFYALFPIINGCALLKRLELNGHSQYHNIYFIGANFCLPNLTALSLRTIGYETGYGVGDGAECEFMKFTKACPALEELYLTDCCFKVKVFCITSNVLKTLRIVHSLRYGCHVTLNTPNLETLLLRDDVGKGYCFNGLDSLQSVEIDVEPYDREFGFYFVNNDDPASYYATVRDLVYGCRNARKLHVGLYPIKSLRHANNQPFPEFQNLTWLSLASVRSEGWVVLAHLLNNAPKLEQLKIEEGFEQTEMGFAYFKQLVPSLPTCLELHIKKVEFNKFYRQENGNRLLVYFVKNGKVLEKLVLNSVVVPIKR